MPYAGPPGTLDAAGAQELYLPDLARGWDPIAPPRSLDPDGPVIYRDLLNWCIRDGHLVRRPGLRVYEAQITQTLARQEVVHRILVYESRYRVTLIVTNRAVYRLRQQGAPLSAYEILYVGPTYTTGTVTVTNGSPNVTGVGTEWSTRSISPGQAFSADGGTTWYEIATVPGNSSLTLTTNYAAATGGGKAYIIRRTFSAFSSPLSGSHDVYMAVFNDTLYLAGSYLGRGDTTEEPAVIKVTDLELSSVSGTYITASKALIPGLDFVSNLRAITGLAVLQDSRVVVSGEEGVLFYSSNLSDTVWTVSPAGQTVVTLHPGAISALGRVGNTLTLHYPDAIVLAHPTGQTDPPLAYQPTAATVGCAYSPRTLRTYEGGEIFVGPDRNLYRFDMSKTTPLGDPLQFKLKGLSPSNMRNLHAAIDLRRRELLVAYDSSSSLTTIYHLSLDRGTWSYTTYGAGIGALTDRMTDLFGADEGQQLVGLNRNDAVGGVVSSTLGRLAEGYYDDSVGGNFGGFRADTEDLDFRLPWHYKIVDHVVVTWKGVTPENQTTKVSVSNDGGSTWVAVTAELLSPPSAEETPLRYGFRDLLTASLTFRIRIEIDSTNRVTAYPVRMLVRAEPTGVIDPVEL